MDGDPTGVYENMTLPQDFDDAIKGRACYNFTTPNKTLDLENTTPNKTLDLGQACFFDPQRLELQKQGKPAVGRISINILVLLYWFL